MVNKIMDNLEHEGYVKLVSQKPEVYKVHGEFLENILVL